MAWLLLSAKALGANTLIVSITGEFGYLLSTAPERRLELRRSALPKGSSVRISGWLLLNDILNWESPSYEEAVQGLRERKSR